MSAQWKALQTSLIRSLCAIRSHQAFDEAKKQQPALAIFSDPSAVVTFLTDATGNLTEKNRVLEGLVAMVQRGEHAALARDMLWLGLWPALDAVYWHQTRYLRGSGDEVVSAIAEIFSSEIQDANLGLVTRLAATLTRNTRRDIIRASKASFLEDELLSADTSASEPIVDSVATRAEASLLGLLPKGSFDADAAALLERLRPLAGNDAELLVAVLVFEQAQGEAAEQFDLSPEAVRKRVHRSLDRIRHHLTKTLSGSDPQNGIYISKRATTSPGGVK